MLTLKDVRQYISGLQITADDRVYIGKLDNKKEKSIGVYPRKGSGPPITALGGYDCSTYGIKRISLLVHWSRSASDSEAAAFALYEKLLKQSSLMIGDSEIRFLVLQMPEPESVGTDNNGVYEYVIWLDFVYQRK